MSTTADEGRLAAAEAALGHRFHDRTLLLRALTHRSYVNEHADAVALGHNEVLELLGDAVLSLVTVEALLRASPDATEGELTVRRAAHVSEPNLAAAAERLGLASLLRVGKGEAQSGGAATRSIRADTLEALLGAVYQDAGLDAARGAAARLLGPPPSTVLGKVASSKTALQERLQRLFGASPGYVVERKEGPDHAPVYVAEVALFAVALGRGEGANKRIATEAAAAAALAELDAVDDAALRARLGPARKQP